MMNFNSNVKKDLKKVQKFSNLVENKLSKINHIDNKRIEKLSYEQLQDLNQLLHIADYVLTKYEGKKEIHSLLKQFVDMINNSSSSMDVLNDEISEMIVSTESAISRIKNLQGNVSENFSIGRKISKNDEKSERESKISTINLTNSTTPVYTHEYLRKSEVKTGQII